MTYGYIMPPLHSRAPIEPRTLKRKYVKIPGLSDQRRFVKFTDEQVIAAIVANLGGKSRSEIAAELGASEEVVRSWCQGTTRRRCHMEAERRWAAELACKLN